MMTQRTLGAVTAQKKEDQTQEMVERLKSSKLNRFFQAHTELRPLTKIGLMDKLDKIMQAMKNMVYIAERINPKDKNKLKACINQVSDIFSVNIR
jgi:hypothetical protein